MFDELRVLIMKNLDEKALKHPLSNTTTQKKNKKLIFASQEQQTEGHGWRSKLAMSSQI
jgi:hypothetical protein